MTLWPDSLPRYPLRAGYGERSAMRVVTFEADSGPPIERPRSTLRLSSVTFGFVMTSDQVRIFEDWVADDLGSGTLPFLMEHPRRQEQVKMRMTGDPRYEIEPSGALEWTVTFSAMVIG